MNITRSKQRRGQVLVIGAVLLVALMSLAAIVVDIGHICATKARLQNTSDAAALAAMHELVEQCVADAAEADAEAAAIAEAGALKDANHADASIQVEFGYWDQNEQEFVPQDEGSDDWLDGYPTAVRATATRDEFAPGGKLGLFFGPAFGFDDTEVQSSTVVRATNDLRGFNFGLNPFAVYEDDIPGLGEEMTFYDDSQAAPGCFGLLDFDGGSNPTGDLEDWILNGYDGQIVLDPLTGCIWLDGNPGFRSALKDEVEERIGDPMIVCVYDQVVSQGSNTQFRIIAFLGLTVTDCKLTGQDKYIKGTVDDLTPAYNVVSGNDNPSGNLYKVHVVQ